MDLLDPLPWRLSSEMNHPNDTIERGASIRHPQPPIAVQPSASVAPPTDLDVVGGRGQGVQRKPGNLRFRVLVSMNKVCWYCLQLLRLVSFTLVD
jgi:hypothetical protein